MTTSGPLEYAGFRAKQHPYQYQVDHPGDLFHRIGHDFVGQSVNRQINKNHLRHFDFWRYRVQTSNLAARGHEASKRQLLWDRRFAPVPMGDMSRHYNRDKMQPWERLLVARAHAVRSGDSAILQSTPTVPSPTHRAITRERHVAGSGYQSPRQQMAKHYANGFRPHATINKI